MSSRLTALAGLLLAAAAPAAASDTVPAANSAASESSKSAQADKPEEEEAEERKICKRIPGNTGSLTSAAKRVCMTRAQWRKAGY